MLRRLAPSVIAKRLVAVGVSSCGGNISSQRWCTTSQPNEKSNSSLGTSNRRSQVQPQRRSPLPPAFDVVHWNDDDITKGHLLRVLHRDSFIVFEYHRQSKKTTDEGSRAERVVSVTLPPAYIARFLGVLEERMEKVDIQSRYTNAVFAPDTAKGKHHYLLNCTSTRPTSGQQPTPSGEDVNGSTIEWEVSFDVAESLMLHRFLSQALQYNSGFGRRA